MGDERITIKRQNKAAKKRSRIASAVTPAYDPDWKEKDAIKAFSERLAKHKIFGAGIYPGKAGAASNAAIAALAKKKKR